MKNKTSLFMVYYPVYTSLFQEVAIKGSWKVEEKI